MALRFSPGNPVMAGMMRSPTPSCQSFLVLTACGSGLVTLGIEKRGRVSEFMLD